MDIKIDDSAKYLMIDALRDTIVTRRKVHANASHLPEQFFCIPQLEDLVTQLGAPRGGFDD